MKRIITHVNPDLDAVTSAWLIQKFLPSWEEAEIGFCQAETTFEGKPVDSDSNVLHVDVGLGKLDHHQTNGFICASKLVLDFIHLLIDELEPDLAHNKRSVSIQT